MLTVITPAATTRLVSVEVMAASLNTTASNDLVQIIDRASSMIARFCGRGFGREVLRQTFRSLAGSVLFLARTPAVITAITLDGNAFDPVRWEVDGASGLLRTYDGSGALGDWCGRLLTVDYAAGYVLPEDQPVDGAPNLPGNVEQACILLVTSLREGQGRDPLLRTDSVEGVGSTSWVDPRAGTGGLPQQVADLLEHDRYLAAG